MTETQQRFLRAIAERVPMDQVVELHLFPPIRQGGVETGVAVVAEDPRRPSPNGTADADAEHAGASIAPDVADELSPTDATAVEPDTVPELQPTDEPATRSENGVEDTESTSPSRLTIHTARYRLTLKGVDRGKWEVDVVAEADAPLEAIDAVIRGVQRRSGEGAEPDRLSTEAFRDALVAPLATLER